MKAKSSWKRGVGYASLRVPFAMALGILFFCSCSNIFSYEDEGDCAGTIALAINEKSFSVMKDVLYDTRSVWSKGMEEIDTNDFILSIFTEQGFEVYNGEYGKRPEEIRVVPGTYMVELRSSAFDGPEFDSPVYGDNKSIVIEKDSTKVVTLMCRQTNAAIRLSFSDDFIENFAGEGLKLCDQKGDILYPYDMEDYCYVTPGIIELRYNNGVSDTLLYSCKISVQQMLTLNLSYAPGSKCAMFKIEKDTVRIWETVNYNAGLKMPAGAVTIEQAKQMIGQENVMVFGFVIGGDATLNTMRVKPPFSSRTNLIMAPDTKERNRYNMFAVELPAGEIREALNLVDNKNILGSAIVVTGNIVESYYGYPGIKSVKSHSVLY